MNPWQEEDLRERASRSFFDRWARTYDDGRISPWFRYTQRMTIDVLRVEPSSSVLDVGCGTGYATVLLASMVPEGKACGVDISPGMIEQARTKVPAPLKGRVEFRQASAMDLGYPDSSFTHVLCTNSFHHYPDPLKALGEMKRVLVSGGRLAMFESAPDLSWYTWAWDRLLRVIEKGHVRYYPSGELGAMIRCAGFEKVEPVALRNEFLKHGKLFASLQLWSAHKPDPSSNRSASGMSPF